MKLRGIPFGSVFNASGACNFFLEDPWWYSRWYQNIVGRSMWDGATFVAKTTTYAPREGNMPLIPGTVTPVEFKPRCIYINLFGGYALNSVGLSGPGAEWLLKRGYWQNYTEPFVISFMSVQKTTEQRLIELCEFATLLANHLPRFIAPVALEINFSCPNVGLDPTMLVGEISQALAQVAGILRSVPRIVKLSIEVPPETMAQICTDPNLDALDLSNTIPFGKLPYVIDWGRLFPSGTSPLEQFGGGGLSGAPLLKPVCHWISTLRRDFGVTIPIIGGGGILSVSDARKVITAGASALSLGTVAMLRPWRVPAIITAANAHFAQ